MCTMKIWKRNDTHFFITVTFLLQNSATRSILSQGKKKKKGVMVLLFISVFYFSGSAPTFRTAIFISHLDI